MGKSNGTLQQRRRPTKVPTEAARKTTNKRGDKGTRAALVAAPSNEVVGGGLIRRTCCYLVNLRSHFKAPKCSRSEVVTKITVLTFGLLVCTPILFLLLDRSPVAEVTEGKAYPDPVLPGQNMSIVWNYNQLRADCSGSVKRTVVDSTGRIFLFRESSVAGNISNPIAQVRGSKLHLDFTAPRGMHEGKALFHADIERWCNWLQRYVWPMKSVTRIYFNVEQPYSESEGSAYYNERP